MARLLWNLALLGLVIGVTIVLAPKVVRQLSIFGSGFESTWRGVEGVGLWLNAVLSLLALAIWSGRSIPRSMRIAYAAAGVALIAGTVVTARLDREAIGFVFWTDYVAFLAVFVIAAAPLVVVGASYPMLARHAWTRRRRMPASRPS